MKNFKAKISALPIGLFVYIDSAISANKLIKPSGVDSVSTSDITNVSDDISGYVIAVLSFFIVMVIFVIAYLYVTGKINDANEKIIGLIAGLLVIAFGAGIVFAVFG